MTGRAPTPIELQSDDGVTLRGLHWPGSREWLILVHDSDGVSDLDSWRPLMPALTDLDWSILTIDLPGHGASDGEWAGELASTNDLLATIRYTQGQDATWIAVLASGQSAVVALELATTIDLDALVLLSPSPAGDVSPRTLRGEGEAKLFAAGAGDPVRQHAAAQLRKSSIGWAMLINVPTEAQGTNLLSGALGGQVRERIVAFLAEQRFLAKTRGVAIKR